MVLALRIIYRKSLKRLASTFVPKNTELHHRSVIFSGIQPTGVPHLGNYLGALKLWVDLQKKGGDIFYSIVDLHALTAQQVECSVSKQTLETAACLLACGIDPKRCTVFRQSDVTEHGALSWVLSCLVQQNVMKHMIQWREKSKNREGAGNLGLFTYPILQCADILLYRATHVPVGNDQKQHLELCQDVAKSFNHKYGQYFAVPKYLENVFSTKINNLRDPFSKMSKSDRSENSKICLNDSDDDVWRKIKRAITDNTSAITFDLTRRPGVSNLIQIHAGVTGLSAEEICTKAQREGINTSQYKMAVAEAIIDHIRPIRSEYEKLISDPHYLEMTLSEGGEKAKRVASKTWNDVTKLIDLK